jgi:cyclopropane fatty-acyl-phospholipid synthase-like methyltransferase
VTSPGSQLDHVRRFYDHWSAQFLASFGPTFQAGFLKEEESAPEDPDTSTLLMAERARIGPGQRVLDAGCGVGGPAMAMASAFAGLTVCGVTLSGVQAAIGRDLIVRAGLQSQVSVLQGDYHRLPFAAHSFDVAVLFESIGYSPDRIRLLGEVARVVRPGGHLYIKDVFAPPTPLTPAQDRDLRAFDQLWHLARSPTISEVRDALTGAGCEIVACGPMANVGNTRFLRAMFDLDPITIVRVNDLGRAFALKSDDLPTFFGEVIARVPG